MADYNIRFYDYDPNVLPTSVGATFNWAGPSDAVGKAWVTDPEAGIQGLTLDDDSAGNESAKANIDLNGVTSTNSNVDAEYVWTVQDTVTGEIFQIAEFDVENGAANGDYTISEIPLVVGRTYEILAVNSNPNVAAGDIAFSSADYIAPNHVVTGTNANDTINAAYTGDPQNDRVDDGFAGGVGGNDNTIMALGGNDNVTAGLGNDTVYGGTGTDTVSGGVGNDLIYGDNGDFSTLGAADSLTGGAGNDLIYGEAGNDTISGGDDNDTLYGGAGNDSLTGGAGNDTILGGTGNDTIVGDGGPPVSSTREYLDWALQGGDGTNIAGGFTQTTGEMEISVSFTNDGDNAPTFLLETSDTAYVETGEDYDPNSMLRLFGTGDGATSTSTFDFSAATGSQMQDEVENVSFRLNDIDSGSFQDIVTVNAYDADGNPVTVTFTPEGDDTVTGNTIFAGANADNVNEAGGSVLIEIAGPVASIEIIYANGGTGGQALYVTDIYFDTIPDNTGSNNADVLDGGDGSDVIDGGAGGDTITGGAGNDTMTGGLGADVFVLQDGSGADVITDFDTDDDDTDGSYNDQLDVSNLTDAEGNPVNAWDVIVSDDGFGNALLAFPNGETILLQGVSPAAVTGAQLLNAAGVPCFTEGTRIRTVRGEVPVEDLQPGDGILTLDNGHQDIRWIGKRHLGGRRLIAQPELKPICIPAGVCGNYAPLFVSPQHGMMLNGDQTGQGEVLVRAKHLAEAAGPVRVANGKTSVVYIHLMFARHQIIFANGAATESFYPGKCALDMFPDQVVAELCALIPGLDHLPAEQAYGPTARRFLKRHEVLKKINLRLHQRTVPKAA